MVDKVNMKVIEDKDLAKGFKVVIETRLYRITGWTDKPFESDPVLSESFDILSDKREELTLGSTSELQEKVQQVRNRNELSHKLAKTMRGSTIQLKFIIN